MKRCALAGALMAVCVLTPARASAGDDAILFRVFLKDGATLVSYGEFARVSDRVVFSMPTGAEGRAGAGQAAPPVKLQLVDIAADRVDWDRTNRYAESARTTHYMTTQAEIDYAAISNQVAETLNQVAVAPDTVKRLALVESARETLASWPRNHFNYRAAEVRQMLTLLDEAIADLRAAGGSRRFDLSLTAGAGESPALEPLMPPPTPREAIEQTLLAARVSDRAVEREALLGAALESLETLETLETRNSLEAGAAAPSGWATAVRAETRAALEVERAVDRRYQAFSKRVLAQTRLRVSRADVHGLERMLILLDRRDSALGRKRPEDINALVTEVQSQLDAARQLRLALDRWALRAPVYRRYRTAISDPVDMLALVARMKPALEDIKALAGTSPGTLSAIHRGVAQIVKRAAAIVPPEELRAAHALIVSAAQMADSAAHIRREATLSADLARAWDASSAAAGALMLAARARSEIQSLMRPPRFK